MNALPLITIVTLTPLVGALVLPCLRKEHGRLAGKLAFAFSAVALLETAALCAGFNSRSGDLQFVQRAAWIPSLGVEYFVGVDGLGLLMVLLAALVVPMALLVGVREAERSPGFYSLVLCLQAGLFGSFTALNFYHWFIFWELSLIPAYFLIKLWGGPGRVPAATQFFIYTLVGSVAMLLAFQALFLATGSFDFIELANLARSGELKIRLAQTLGQHGLSGDTLALLIFLGALLGFAVKVPLMPFHTWLPGAYAEAPSSVTMILTGVMSKMGVYAFVRLLLPIFPDQLRAALTPLLWLAVITIIFSACAAFAQRDLKRVLAYSSINHLGYCLLGVFAVAQATSGDPRWTVERSAALNGVVLQMFNHGITAALLFGFVSLLERRTGGIRDVQAFGGLRKVAPVLAGLMGIVVFASIGLPGLNGFVSEFLIFKGVFSLATWAAALSVVGLLVTAIFYLTVLQRIFHGPVNEAWRGLPDLTLGERLIVGPAVALLFVVGLYPQAVIGLINSTVLRMIGHI